MKNVSYVEIVYCYSSTVYTVTVIVVVHHHVSCKYIVIVHYVSSTQYVMLVVS